MAGDRANVQRAQQAKADVQQAAEQCPVCEELPCDAFLRPCRHSSCCFKCAERLRKAKKACPRCDASIGTVEQVNL